MRQWNKKWLAVLIVGLFLWSALALPAQAADEAMRSEVAGLLQNNYVDQVPAEVLQAPTIEQMLKKLGDPYAEYYTKEEFKREMENLNGEFTGIGVYFRPERQGALVFGLIDGSPAAKAGVKENDLIIEADGKTLVGLDVDKISAIIRGPVNTRLALKIKRGSQVLDLTVTREKLNIPTVKGEKLPDGTGIIVLAEFGANSGKDMGKVIKELKDKKVNRWILDMRENPGGFLETALEVSGYFIGPGDTVIVKERKNTEVYPGQPSEQYVEEPLIVLANENSASAAEIVTAALKDQQRALILGNTTYGKGTVQQMFELSNGDQLKFTIAKFYSPLDKPINGLGVTPDIKISDEQVLKAAQLIFYDIPENYPGKLVRIDTDSFSVDIDPVIARTGGYWAAWTALLDGSGKYPVYSGNNIDGWQPLEQEQRANRWPLYYPGYEFKGEMAYDQQKGLMLDFLDDVKPSYLNSSNINLINATSGERIPLQFSSNNGKQVVAKPQKSLTAGEYWLVVDSTYLKFNDGHKLDKGLLARVKV